jgi:hypothetical protein
VNKIRQEETRQLADPTRTAGPFSTSSSSLSTFFRIGTGGEVGDWSDPAQIRAR